MKFTPVYILYAITTTYSKLTGINESGCPKNYSIAKVIPHENCYQYYQCLNGVKIARFCPSGLHFNPKLGKCDWPGQAKCINNQEDLDEIPIKRMKSFDHVETETSEELDKSNPSHAPMICSGEDSNNILVAHEYCNHFYKCSYGRPIALKCAKNLLYNLLNEKCDLPLRVECGERYIPSKEELYRVNRRRIINRSHSNEQSLLSADRFSANIECEKPGSDGDLYPHEYCDRYYECQNGQPVVMKCPVNLLYNHLKKYCDWPRNVFCGDRTLTDNDQRDNSSDDEDENNDNTSEGSDDSKDSLIKTDPSRAPLICSTPNSDGIVLAHEKCNKFYKCFGGRPIALLCPDNLLYNLNKEYCDWPRNVNCGDRTIVTNDKDNAEEVVSESEEHDDVSIYETKLPTGNYSDPSKAPSICFSPGSDGTMVAHENCHQFYKCHDGLPVAIQCPAGLLYNSTLQYCDWPSNVDCGDRVHIEGDNDRDNSILSKKANTTYSDPAVAVSICQADNSDGVFVAHNNCNQFYKCYDKKPVAFSCQLNLLYDPLKEFCDWPRNVDCGTRKVPELAYNTVVINSTGGEGFDNSPHSCAGKRDGDIIPNEHCSQFVKCVGKRGQIMKCPSGLYFNVVLKACDWPMNVNCGNRLTEAHIVRKTTKSRRALNFF